MSQEVKHDHIAEFPGTENPCEYDIDYWRPILTSYEVASVKNKERYTTVYRIMCRLQVLFLNNKKLATVQIARDAAI